MSKKMHPTQAEYARARALLDTLTASHERAAEPEPDVDSDAYEAWAVADEAARARLGLYAAKARLDAAERPW